MLTLAPFWKGFLRNVCVALGNTGNPDHFPILQQLSQHNDPLIAEHASWALRQIQNRQKTNTQRLN